MDEDSWARRRDYSRRRETLQHSDQLVRVYGEPEDHELRASASVEREAAGRDNVRNYRHYHIGQAECLEEVVDNDFDDDDHDDAVSQITIHTHSSLMAPSMDNNPGSELDDVRECVARNIFLPYLFVNIHHFTALLIAISITQKRQAACMCACNKFPIGFVACNRQV
eukprot:scpid93264/ scgid5023/ 